MEVCCTLGMLSDEQARRLAAAGLTAYNHNLDTSPEFYGEIITTRALRRSPAHHRRGPARGHHRLLRRHHRHGRIRRGPHRLAASTGHARSASRKRAHQHAGARPGTPLGDVEPVDPLTLVRTIATARLLMPARMVRLSAGRRSLTREAAALCFLAGANSIFVGEKLLTTPNPERDEDDQLFRDLGLRAIAAVEWPNPS